MSAPDRRAMVERRGVDLSVRRQCTLLNLARSGVYRPKPVIDADDLAVMRRIDELHLELPFYGSRWGAHHVQLWLVVWNRREPSQNADHLRYTRLHPNGPKNLSQKSRSSIIDSQRPLSQSEKSRSALAAATDVCFECWLSARLTRCRGS